MIEAYADCVCGRRIVGIPMGPSGNRNWFHTLGAWTPGEHWDGHKAQPQPMTFDDEGVLIPEGERRAMWGDR